MMKKTCSLFVLFIMMLALCACSDKGSSSPNESALPTEVADKAELETYECNDDVIGEKVYVTELEENYECDGEKWFKSYDQTKLSSSSTKSSSSKKTDGSSDSKKSNKDGSSSSDNDVPDSNQGSVNVKIMPSGTYDCSKYKCVTTENLNQDFLESGKYGEFLDERDGRVYKTVIIGVGERTQTWMAQNMNYSNSLVRSYCYDDLEENCEKYGGLYDYKNAMKVCPEGWHLPSVRDYGKLKQSVGEDSSLKSRDGWGVIHQDRFGFSALPAGISRSNSGMKYYYYDAMGEETWFWTTEIHEKKEHFAQQGDVYRLGDGIQSWFVDERYSVRCVKDTSERNPADTIVIKGYEGSYGTLVDKRDGKVYKTVMMGDREWMAEDLDYDSSTTRQDGAFYTAIESRVACPQGWHLPYADEWRSLVIYVDSNRGDVSIASALKSTEGWYYHPDVEPGRNLFGFALTAAGYYSGTSHSWDRSEQGTASYHWVRDYDILRNEQEVFKLRRADSSYSIRYENLYTRTRVRCIKNLYSDYEYGTLTDARDGKKYKTTKIGTQNWMAENLDYAYLQPIGEKDSSSFCLMNEPDSCAKYGRLYAYEIIMDSTFHLCPSGWHIPNYKEWEYLYSNVKDANPQSGMICPSGLMLRSDYGWDAGNAGLNVYGISILPSGYLFEDTYIEGVAYLAYSSDSKHKAGYLNFNPNESNCSAEFPTTSQGSFSAYAIRCVQDE